MKYREDMVAKQNADMMKQQSEQLGKDTVLIDNYLKEKNIVAKKTSVGLRYVIKAQGLGPNVKDGQKAKVNYAGYLLDGKYFDTNIESIAKAQNLYNEQRKYDPIEVVLGRRGVIQGWEEALKLMNKGSKMTVYIPSTLAYGNRKASQVIGENSILIFDMELVGVE
jgi:FKBP-type peptidyl-prolyl cis-trans isomerase